MKNTMTRLSALLVALLLCVSAVVMTGCTAKPETPADTAATETTTEAATEATTEAATEANVIGEGAVAFVLTVTHRDGSAKTFNVHTDKKTVGEALVELNLIAGEVGQYGLYVKTVDGELCDYDVDQTYWAFYINGEYATKGVDATDVVAGATYALTATK